MPPKTPVPPPPEPAAEEIEQEPEVEEIIELPEDPSVELAEFPGVHLSKVCISVWFPDKPRILLGEPEPQPEGEEEPPEPEVPAEPVGPDKELLFQLIPRRIMESSVFQQFNIQKRQLMKAEEDLAGLPAETEEADKEAAQAVVDKLKNSLLELEPLLQELKGSYQPEPPIPTFQWMNNLMDLTLAGCQTLIVGGPFWPATDMMSLFGKGDHFGDCEKLLTTFKTRYLTERARPLSMFFKLVPNVFQEEDETPIDYVPLLDKMLKNTGQDPENEEAEVPPKLDLVQLYWWDCEASDYVRACRAILGSDKVRALGLVNFPLPALKTVYRAGIDVATLEVNYPIGALEKKDFIEVLDFCALHRIKVLYSNALLGGLVHRNQVKKLAPPGMGFRPPVDPTGPMAEGLIKVREWGGWDKFQKLLATLDTIAVKHDTSPDVVCLRYYLNKGVHPIIGVPWGEECMASFPNLKTLEEEFLDTGDMRGLEKAFAL